MKNIGEMMRQAQQMQEKMTAMQEAMADLEVEGSAGAGLVSIRLNGKGELKSVTIDPSLFNAEDAEVVEDLILAAHSDAKAKTDAKMQEEMSTLTGGLQLPPGFKMPF